MEQTHFSEGIQKKYVQALADATAQQDEAKRELECLTLIFEEAYGEDESCKALSEITSKPEMFLSSDKALLRKAANAIQKERAAKEQAQEIEQKMKYNNMSPEELLVESRFLLRNQSSVLGSMRNENTLLKEKLGQLEQLVCIIVTLPELSSNLLQHATSQKRNAVIDYLLDKSLPQSNTLKVLKGNAIQKNVNGNRCQWECVWNVTSSMRVFAMVSSEQFGVSRKPFTMATSKRDGACVFYTNQGFQHDGKLEIHCSCDHLRNAVFDLVVYDAIKGTEHADSMWQYTLPPVHIAAKLGESHIVEKLLDNGADPEIIADYCDPFANGNTALELAALHAKLDVVKVLVEKGADVHQYIFKVPFGKDGDLVAGYLQTNGCKGIERF